jgi:hypothetical protein
VKLACRARGCLACGARRGQDVGRRRRARATSVPPRRGDPGRAGAGSPAAARRAGPVQRDPRRRTWWRGCWSRWRRRSTGPVTDRALVCWGGSGRGSPRSGVGCLRGSAGR